jgi:glycosyltransferase involved in cell wall biosynthesis
MQRLRIALVADTMVGWSGGGVVSARRFTESLRARHRVVVVGASLPPGDPDCVRLPGFRLPVQAMRDMQFVMARPDRASLREAFAQVDLVHLQFPFWLSFVALDEARAMGRPVVASFHVQPENAWFNVGVRSPWVNQLTYRLWVNRLYNRADAVVCPSVFAENKLRSYGLCVPTHVISNGTAPDLGRSPALRRPKGGGEVLVLSVGRMAAEKRQDVLIEAIAQSRYRDRIRLVLAGPGTLDPALRRKAYRLPVRPEIGFVDRARLEQLLESADVFVHPSDVELEGMAVVEAMAMGLPVLVSDSPESAAAGFALDERFRFRSGDPQALADRLDALLARPDVLREASVGYAAMARTLDFGQSVEHLVEVYRSVLPSQTIADSRGVDG